MILLKRLVPEWMHLKVPEIHFKQKSLLFIVLLCGFLVLAAPLISFELPRTKEDYLRLLQKQPDQFDLMLDYTVWLVRNNDPDAEYYLTRSERINPYSPELFYWKGEFFLRQSQWQQSLKSFRKATKLYPRFKAAHKKIKYVQDLITANKDLVAEKLKLFRQQPNLLNLILLQRELEKENRKRRSEVLAQLLKSNSRFPVIHFWLAMDYRETGDVEKEIFHLNAYLKKYPSKSSIRLRLAKLYEHSGRSNFALQQYERLIQLGNAFDPPVFLARGRILLSQHKYSEAVDHFYSSVEKRNLLYASKQEIEALKEHVNDDERMLTMLLQLYIQGENWKKLERLLITAQPHRSELFKRFKQELGNRGWDQKLIALRLEAKYYQKTDSLQDEVKVHEKILAVNAQNENSLKRVVEHIHLITDPFNAIHYLTLYTQRHDDLEVWKRLNELSVQVKNKELEWLSFNKIASLEKEKNWILDQKRIKLAVELNRPMAAILILKPWKESIEHEKEALQQIGELYRKTGVFAEALKAYEAGADAGISEQDFLENYVNLLLKQEQFVKAAEILETLRKTDQGTDIWNRLFRVYVQGALWDQAYSLLDEELRFNGVTKRLLKKWTELEARLDGQKKFLMEGSIALQQGQLTAAARAFDRLKNPEKEVVEKRIGIFAEQNDWRGLNHFLDRYPAHDSWHYWKSEVLINQRLYDTADTFLRKGFILNPGKLRLLLQRARIYSRQGRREDAEKLFATLIEKEYSGVQVSRFQAIHFQRFKAWKLAEPIWRRLTREYPDNASYWNSLGAVYSQQKKWEQSENAFNQAIHLKKDYTAAYYNLALVLVAQKRKDELGQVLGELQKLDQNKSRFISNWWQRRWKEAR